MIKSDKIRLMVKNKEEQKLVVYSHILNKAVLELNDGQLEGLPKNPRYIKDEKFAKLKLSLEQSPEFLKARPLLVYPLSNGHYIIVGGNMRFLAGNEVGITDYPCYIFPKETTTDKLKEYVIKDNIAYGSTDWDALANDDWDINNLEDWGVEIPDFLGEEKEDDIEGGKGEQETDDDVEHASLEERFIIPPFSVIDTRMGYWQKRKKAWVASGLKSELGRSDNLLKVSPQTSFAGFYDVKNDMIKNGLKPTAQEVVEEGKRRGYTFFSKTSIFDPVLCEIMYTWFNVKGGTILDPFAGGSVRGIVASKLGYRYYGNDLREEQIKANVQNATEMGCMDSNFPPTWTCGDSAKIDDILSSNKIKENFDMIFSCPPYADLEVYSDRKEDISNMDYPQFLEAYRSIIRKSCDKLKDNRFAAFVVGEVRDSKGFYRNFVADTIQAFLDCGLKFYNKIILLNVIGMSAMRAPGMFNVSRKVCKVHQDILVFFKGDPKTVRDDFGDVVPNNSVMEQFGDNNIKEIEQVNA